MKKKMVVYANRASKSAVVLSKALNARRVRYPTGPRARRAQRGSPLLINWGNTNVPDWGEWLNHPDAVWLAVNKRHCLEVLEEAGVPVIPNTTSIEEAAQWLADGHSVIERPLLRSHSGKGIRLVTPGDELQRASLYSRYLGKRREYRVHVLGDAVGFVQQKKRRNHTEQDDVVRNFRGGWVYSHKDITPISDDAIKSALESVHVLGLTIGAVDIITKGSDHYVLEVNTSPGLVGSTVGVYADYINKIYISL